MAFYRVCQFCGCSLDPGEQCDCQDEENEENKIVEIESKKKGKRNIPTWRELKDLLLAQ